MTQDSDSSSHYLMTLFLSSGVAGATMAIGVGSAGGGGELWKNQSALSSNFAECTAVEGTV